MTVGELLKELEHCPDDAEVVLRLTSPTLTTDHPIIEATWFPRRTMKNESGAPLAVLSVEEE